MSWQGNRLVRHWLLWARYVLRRHPVTGRRVGRLRVRLDVLAGPDGTCSQTWKAGAWDAGSGCWIGWELRA